MSDAVYTAILYIYIYINYLFQNILHAIIHGCIYKWGGVQLRVLLDMGEDVFIFQNSRDEDVYFV